MRDHCRSDNVLFLVNNVRSGKPWNVLALVFESGHAVKADLITAFAVIAE